MGIELHRCRENLVLAIRIFAALNGPPADQIHGAAKEFFKIKFDRDPLEQSALLVWPKCAKQIHVAVIAEIIPERRAEQFQPGDSVLLAKFCQRCRIELHFHVANMQQLAAIDQPLAWLATRTFISSARTFSASAKK